MFYNVRTSALTVINLFIFSFALVHEKQTNQNIVYLKAANQKKISNIYIYIFWLIVNILHGHDFNGRAQVVRRRKSQWVKSVQANPICLHRMIWEYKYVWKHVYIYIYIYIYVTGIF